jgi:hypothetical protein
MYSPSDCSLNLPTFAELLAKSRSRDRNVRFGSKADIAKWRGTKMQEGIAAWKAWVEKHHAAIVGMGGPLGKTKKVSEGGIEDISNLMSGYTIVRAASHDAAAKLFEKHPHFAVFHRDPVEIMPLLPIPSA